MLINNYDHNRKLLNTVIVINRKIEVLHKSMELNSQIDIIREVNYSLNI